jgi:CBS domain-containing protein
MRVCDLMTRSLVTAAPSMPVLDARALMAKSRIRHLLVVDDGQIIGIVTDRDIRLNLPSPATSLSVWEVNYLLARLTVGQVMSKSVISVDPQRDAREAARIMIEEKIGALPVVDGGRPVGIVTESDFLKAFVGLAEELETAGVARG